MTPATLPEILIGNPKAPCNPNLEAMDSLGKFLSTITSVIHAGCPFSHTRPGNPIPFGKVISLLTASNSLTSQDGLYHILFKVSIFVPLSINHISPIPHPLYSHIALRVLVKVSLSPSDSDRIFVIEYFKVNRFSSFLCSILSSLSCLLAISSCAVRSMTRCSSP